MINGTQERRSTLCFSTPTNCEIMSSVQLNDCIDHKVGDVTFTSMHTTITYEIIVDMINI